MNKNNSLVKKVCNNDLARNFKDVYIIDVSRSWFPEVHIAEGYKSVIVRANIPGMKKEDIHIKLNKNILTISGKEKNKREEKSENGYCCESSYGSFSQFVSLPDNISGKNIKTKYTDGILEIAIPKKTKTK